MMQSTSSPEMHDTYHCPAVRGLPNTKADSKMDRNCRVVMMVANTSAPNVLIV